MIENIVVIDDSEADRYLVKRAIQRSGLDVGFVEYDTALAALEDFQDSSRFKARIGETPPPVLVLLDINMPRMNGFEFLERLQDVGADNDFVVMMITSSSNPSEKARGQSYELVVDHIVKPITGEQLERIAQRPEFQAS